MKFMVKTSPPSPRFCPHRGFILFSQTQPVREWPAGLGEAFPRNRKYFKSPKMREEGSTRAQALSGSEGIANKWTKSCIGGRGQGCPNWWSGGSRERGRVMSRLLKSSQVSAFRAPKAGPCTPGESTVGSPCRGQTSVAEGPPQSPDILAATVERGYTCWTRRRRWEVLRRSLL